MPAKPLSDEQRRDAARLLGYFKAWQSARREQGLPSTQKELEAAQLLPFKQSAISQYLRGRIPLNADALHHFACLLGVQATNISPSIVREQQALASALASSADRPRKQDQSAA